jgi:drug/metabolite transporter (DMT)-like permease
VSTPGNEDKLSDARTPLSTQHSALSTGFRQSPFLLLTLCALFWAGNSVVGRALHDSVPPVTLAFWRWCIALLILMPWVAGPLRRQWRAIVANWRVMLLLSLLGVATYNTLNYTALQTTTATNSALINSVCTVLIIVVNFVMFQVRASALQWTGVAVSLAGTLVIVSRGDPAVLTGLEFVRGDVLLMVLALFWALYTACLRWRPRDLDALGFLGGTIVIGLLVLAPLYVWEALNSVPVTFTPGVAAGVAYTGIFPSVLAYLFWNRGVAEVGANRAGQFLHLIPVFGTLLAVIFLGESLRLFHLFGAVLIFAGIYLAAPRGPPRRD